MGFGQLYLREFLVAGDVGNEDCSLCASVVLSPLV